MAIEGAGQLGPRHLRIRRVDIRNIEFKKALQVPESGDDVEIQLSLSKCATSDNSWYGFRIFSFGSECIEHCCGRIFLEFEASPMGEVHPERNISNRPYLDKLSAINNICTSQADSQSLYSSIRGNGINYGPYFQTLNNIRCGAGGAAVAHISLPDLGSTASSQSIDQEAYAIHPTLLDGFFQLIFPALNGGGVKDLPSMVPSFVRKLVFYPEEQEPSALPHFWAGTLANFEGYSRTVSDVIVTSKDNQICAILEGYQTTFVSFVHSPISFDPTRRLLLNYMKWRPDLGMMTADQCVEFCNQDRAPSESIKSFYKMISQLKQYYIMKSLASVSHSSTLATTSRDAYAMDSRQEHEPGSNGKHFPMLLDYQNLPISEGDIPTMEEAAQNASAIGKFCVKLGNRLLDAGLDDGGLHSSLSMSGLVDAHFSNEPQGLGFLKPLCNWLVLALHKDPSMRIFEVGPSQGTFSPLVSSLDAAGLRLCQYDYSVPSSEVLAEIQLRLSDRRNLSTGYLVDLEKHSSLQDLEKSSYDLVIALYLLEEPCCLTKALGIIRKLLKPGGKLILFGSTMPQTRLSRMYDAISARSTGTLCQKRISSGVEASQNSTHQILLETGFSGIDVEIRDTEDESLHERSLLISTVSESIQEKQFRFPPIMILVKRGLSDQLTFAHSLKQQLTELIDCDSGICELDRSLSEQAFSGKLCISLLEYGNPFFLDIGSDDFTFLKTIINGTKSILWIVKDAENHPAPSFHMVDGLSRCLRSEDVNLKFVRLKIESSSTNPATIVKAMVEIAQSTLNDTEAEYEQRNGVIHVNRVLESSSMNDLLVSKLAKYREKELDLHGELALVASLQNPGLLNSINFEKGEPPQGQCLPDEIVIEVCAIGPSLRDYQIASGQLDDTRMFFNCSGVVIEAGSQAQLSPGDKVMAYYPGSCRTVLKCKAAFVAKLPESYDLFGAAALCSPALTAFHSLINIARLEKGETVLIHHAAEAMGRVAIQIAQNVGATVIATATTKEEFEILETEHNIAKEHILVAERASLKQPVLRSTHDRGVNVILNFRSRSDFEESLEVVAPFGRLVDSTGEPSCEKTLGFEAASKCITYSTVDLPQMQLHCPSLLQSLLSQVSSWIREGRIALVPRPDTYSASSIPQALQSFNNDRVARSVAIDFSPGQTVKVNDVQLTRCSTSANWPLQARIPNEPSCHFNENFTYVVAGGFGGLGRSVVRWIVGRGARHLLVLSRSGASSDSAREVLGEMISQGVNIQAPACDIASTASLQTAIAHCSTNMPPIRGCIQATMILRDAIFSNMTHDDFITSTRPKTLGSWNLHSLLPKAMDFFVQLSSVVGILGGSSQGNYAAGNTFEDALARHRVAQGEKAVSIDLGMMVSEGVLAENTSMLDGLRRLGYLMEVSQDEFFALLDHYCDPALPILPPDESQIVVGIEHPAAIEAKGIDLPEFMHRPLFRHFHLRSGNQAAGSNSTGAGAGKQSVDTEDVLRQAASADEAAEHIAQWLVVKLAQVLGVPAEEVDHQRPVRTNGLNSLAAVEMKTWFDRKVGAEVAVFEILGNKSLIDLCRHAAEKSRFR